MRLKVKASRHLLTMLPAWKELRATWTWKEGRDCEVYLDLWERVITDDERCVVELLFEAQPVAVAEVRVKGVRDEDEGRDS